MNFKSLTLQPSFSKLIVLNACTVSSGSGFQSWGNQTLKIHSSTMLIFTASLHHFHVLKTKRRKQSSPTAACDVSSDSTWMLHPKAVRM